jgi:hypothetical protein
MTKATRRRHPSILLLTALLVSTLLGLAPSEARAGEAQLAVGMSGAATQWQGDGAAYGSLKLGYRFEDIVAIYYLGRLGYGGVDERMLTFLSLGAQLWGRIGFTRPYVRAAFVHQHEESVSAIQGDSAGALFGVGDGIRHRAGGEGALGVDFPFHKQKSLEIFASVEGNVDYFPDPRGPAWYGGGGVALGFNYTL